MPRLLLISPTTLQQAYDKGVAHQLEDFDEGGFFECVVIAFPFAPASRAVELTPRLQVVELGADWMPFRQRWLRRLFGPLHILWSARRLARLIRQEKLDLVRATDPLLSGLVGWLAARLAGVLFCVSIHSDYDKRYALAGAGGAATFLGSRALANLIERLVLSGADRVFPIRESLIPYARARGTRPERIQVFPHGLDLSPFRQPAPFDVRGLLGIPAERHVVSFVGRLSRENYVDDLLEVARRLAARRRDFMLVMAGGGPEQGRLERQVAADPVLQDVVRIAGFRPRETVYALRQASAVALCLMGGFSLIEACAAGAPVIAYDVEWHHELVRDGITGHLVAEGDAAAVATALADLLDRPDAAKEMGARARALAFERHDLPHAMAVKRSFYRNLLGLPAGGAA